MKRLLFELNRIKWILMACFHTKYSDELSRMRGWGEYLAHHGIGNEIDDEYRMIEGDAIISLDKKLNG